MEVQEHGGFDSRNLHQMPYTAVPRPGRGQIPRNDYNMEG